MQLCLGAGVPGAGLLRLPSLHPTRLSQPGSIHLTCISTGLNQRCFPARIVQTSESFSAYFFLPQKKWFSSSEVLIPRSIWSVVLSHNPPLTMASYKENVLEEQKMHAYTPKTHTPHATGTEATPLKSAPPPYLTNLNSHPSGVLPQYLVLGLNIYLSSN